MKKKGLKEEYHEAKEIMSETKKELEEISKKTDIMKGGEENLEAFFTVKDVEDKLQAAKEVLDYLGRSTKEGTITEDPEHGKFYIAYDDGEERFLLSKGNPLEILIWGEWILGKVDVNSDGEYYFTGEGQPILAQGMKARLRTQD